MRKTLASCLLLLLAAALFGEAPARAALANYPPPPDPGLEASVRAADVIAEVEVLAGGPFRCVVALRRIFKGEAPKVCELEGYNSVHGNAVQGGFVAGGRFILFLSRTDRADVLAPLTPRAPRLAVNDEGVLLTLGDPPFRIPIQRADMEPALHLLVEAGSEGPPEQAWAFLKGLWDKNELETRYLVVTLAGTLHEKRAVGLLAQAARDKLLRLRLTAVEALGKIGSAEARTVLREVLKDDRSIAAREAARALIRLKDLPAVPQLLEWARRLAAETGKLPPKDPRREPLLDLYKEFVLFLDEEGPLLPPGDLCPALWALAGETDDSVAELAFFLLGTLARREDVDRLLPLAADEAHLRRRDAALALFRATLKSPAEGEDLKAWWQGQRATFGEASRDKAAQAAAVGLALAQEDAERDALTSVLRAAPGETALAAAAPFLTRARSAFVFSAQDLNFWRTPLALPFLIERLGGESDLDRRHALEGLALLAHRHPRLAGVARTCARAQLAADGSSTRRMAASAAGLLEDTRALPALLDALPNGGGYEAVPAALSIYQLTARTLGYGDYEPAADRVAGVRRLAGWWDGLGAAQGQWRPPFRSAWLNPETVAVPPAELERLCQGEAARAASAAFATLFALRGPEDPFWTSLLASSRPRVRAYGVLGLCGGPGTLAPRLKALLVGEQADPAELVRAMAVFTLATLRDGQGAQELAAWLGSPQLPAESFWRRLGITALGLADDEPQSRAYLARAVAEALAVEAPAVEAPAPDNALPLRAVVTALCARADGTAALNKALAAQADGPRETAIRALALRRAYSSTAEVLAAVGRADRFSVADLARAVAPLPRVQDAAVLVAMLEFANDPRRAAAVTLLTFRPDLARSAAARGGVLDATRDERPAIRADAAVALGKIRAKSAIPTLVRMLKDEDEDVRAYAAEALAETRDAEACAAAVREAPTFVRRDIRWLRALACGGGETEVDDLIRSSKSEFWDEQTAAIAALGYASRPEAVARLLDLFRNPASPWETLAAEALARQPGAVEAVAADLASPQAADRTRAAHLLACLADPSEPAGMRAASAARERLLKLLDSADASLRLLADWGLRRASGGKDAGFDASAAPAAREAAARRWRELWGGR